MNITVRTFRTSEDLTGLRQPWQGLLCRSSYSSLFLSWDWQRNWFERYGKKREKLLCLGFFLGDRMVGLAPFSAGPAFAAMARALHLMGQDFGYHLDIIVEKGLEVPVAEALADELQVLFKTGVLAASFTHLRAASVLARALRELGRRSRYLVSVEQDGPSWAVELPGSFQEYEDTLDRKLLKKLKYYDRRLKRDYSFDLAFCESADDFRESWDSFRELHVSSVRSRGKRSMIERDDFSEFYRSVAASALESGVLRMLRLKLDGEVVAALFGIRHGDTFNYINVGYRTLSIASLGYLMPFYAMDAAITERLKVFDFLGGGQGKSKEDLGGIPEYLEKVSVWKNRTCKEVAELGKRARKCVGRFLRLCLLRR